MDCLQAQSTINPAWPQRFKDPSPRSLQQGSKQHPNSSSRGSISSSCSLRHLAHNGARPRLQNSTFLSPLHPFLSSFPSLLPTVPLFPHPSPLRRSPPLTVRSAGRSKAMPRMRPKPKGKPKPPKNPDRANLMRRGRRKELSPEQLARLLLESPQLSVEGTRFPLLSSCLSPRPLGAGDFDWMEENLDEIKEGLGLELGFGFKGMEGREGEGEEGDEWEGVEEEEEEGEGSFESRGGEGDGEWEGEKKEVKFSKGGEEVEANGREALARQMPAVMAAKRESLEGGGEQEREEQQRGLLLPAGEEEEEEEDSSPRKHLDHLLYLAYMHREYPKKPRHLKVANSRLSFLGGFVLELVLAEYFLQRFPRETSGDIRHRVTKLTAKSRLPYLLLDASLDRLVFPDELLNRVERKTREPAAKFVFNALIGAVYLTMGIPEVTRVLFEVFGLDPDEREIAPAPGAYRDEDYLPEELEGEPMTWQEFAEYQSPQGSLFAHPRLFRACVPPGMHKFCGSDWMRDSLRPVLEALGYPRPSSPTDDVRIKYRRNEELALALQLCFIHPSLYKRDHPRFCYERLEYVGQKIQDLVLAERLLMQHLDAPILWLEDKHGEILRNRTCGKYLKEKGLEKHILVSDYFVPHMESNRRFKFLTSGSVYQALHGVGYLVYGKPEVRRLMYSTWQLEGGWYGEC